MPYDFTGIVFKPGANETLLVSEVFRYVPIVERGTYDELCTVGKTRLKIAAEKGILTDEFIRFALDYINTTPEVIGI